MEKLTGGKTAGTRKWTIPSLNHGTIWRRGAISCSTTQVSILRRQISMPLCMDTSPSLHLATLWCAYYCNPTTTLQRPQPPGNFLQLALSPALLSSYASLLFIHVITSLQQYKEPILCQPTAASNLITTIPSVIMPKDRLTPIANQS